MLYTTYYVKAKMTRNLKSLANLPVNQLTCQPVNLKFRQRVIYIKVSSLVIKTSNLVTHGHNDAKQSSDLSCEKNFCY